MPKKVAAAKPKKAVSAEKQLIKLREQADSIPGVADLIELYESHAELVAKTHGYLRQQSRFTVVTSGDTTI